jgi:hypothetical protein
LRNVNIISNAEKIEKMMRRINSNDAGTMDALGTCYDNVLGGDIWDIIVIMAGVLEENQMTYESSLQNST